MNSRTPRPTSSRLPALAVMLTALLLGIVFTAFSSGRTFAATDDQAVASINAPLVAFSPVQVQDDDGEDDDHDRHDNDHRNDNDDSQNDSSRDDSSHNNSSRDDSSRNDSSRDESRQLSNVTVAQRVDGPVNYKPRRSVRGIWVVDFKPFFVDSNTTLGPGVQNLRPGQSVGVIYYTDAYGLNRAIWVGAR